MSRSLCHALLILLWCAALPLPLHAETKVLTAEATGVRFGVRHEY